jgi:hypothetical protein
MKKNKAVDCPVNFTPINQNKVRLTAMFVFMLSALYLFVPHWSIAALLVVDFFFRSFGLGRYSFLGGMSSWLIKKLSLPYKPVDSGAKEFAAVVGFVVSDILFITSSLYLYDVGVYIAGVLLCFSFLEVAFNFCAGCYIYTYCKDFVQSQPVENTASF